MKFNKLITQILHENARISYKIGEFNNLRPLVCNIVSNNMKSALQQFLNHYVSRYDNTELNTIQCNSTKDFAIWGEVFDVGITGIIVAPTSKFYKNIDELYEFANTSELLSECSDVYDVERLFEKCMRNKLNKEISERPDSIFNKDFIEEL